jgi:hypothetical protein
MSQLIPLEASHWSRHPVLWAQSGVCRVLRGEHQYCSQETPFLTMKIRIRRKAGNEKLQIMDMVTEVPLEIVKADPTLAATIPPVQYAAESSGKRKRDTK